MAQNTPQKKTGAAHSKWTLPVAFYFQVKIGSDKYPFKEVSGLTTELELESISEGGVNDFEYKLPKQIKHPNLVLKRALLPLNSKVITWVKKILEGDGAFAIEPKDIVISLQKDEKTPLYTWTCQSAYPVKWEVEALDSEKNSILIETLELAYTTLKRL